MTAVALVPARLMPQTPRVELLEGTDPTSVEAMVVQSAGDSRMTTRMLLRQRQSSKPVKFARTTRASPNDVVTGCRTDSPFDIDERDAVSLRPFLCNSLMR